MKTPVSSWIAILAFFSVSAFGQDTAYYQSAFNTADDTLKLRLHQLIKGHVEFTYTSTSTDVWDILKRTDADTLDSTKVVLLYSNRSINGAQEYNSGSGWSREHVWAKSRGDFGNNRGPGTDVHHLRPADISVNSTRNNRNFDDCVTCADVVDNGFVTGSKTDQNNWTFAPPPNVKGDVARMIFYMAVRYEGGNGEPDLELTNSLQTNTSKAPLHAVLTTLLAWNRQDPVSSWEHRRNNIIHQDYQQNRNPFIDFPEIAEHLWGDSLGVAWMRPVSGVGIPEIPAFSFDLYPSAEEGHFMVRTNFPAQRIQLINNLGQELLSFNNPALSQELNLRFLAPGVYIVMVQSEGNMELKRVILR
jgi:endonuclease I